VVGDSDNSLWRIAHEVGIHSVVAGGQALPGTLKGFDSLSGVPIFESLECVADNITIVVVIETV
jgi:hypothetical protein